MTWNRSVIHSGVWHLHMMYASIDWSRGHPWYKRKKKNRKEKRKDHITFPFEIGVFRMVLTVPAPLRKKSSSLSLSARSRRTESLRDGFVHGFSGDWTLRRGGRESCVGKLWKVECIDVTFGTRRAALFPNGVTHVWKLEWPNKVRPF